ncbi:hypothetical protein L6654_08180 [Bradyrhizobium sp. WYCCWR 13023]|uniref:Uncharacterized protein n=1 Tax=Bradyrhizobium zhengyangense TaxID=2911009 RepID=A0A9X1R7T1_9BRAD|nr:MULTISPECIES: hypothetical protein [Bradyrhizobium]MCG2626600.1 hypothetical protein [Bradyrhizobium zhengyangense]MCG2665647.1 hypothetical protein [Bradyrhizobium zhengyangense]
MTVQMPGGSSSTPIPLGTAAGDIMVAKQGQGDCTVIIDPQTRRVLDRQGTVKTTSRRAAHKAGGAKLRSK